MTSPSRFDVTSLGEVLLRFAVGAGTRLAEARSFEVSPAGAEMNTCAALANLDRKTGFISALPDNDLAVLALRKMREAAIDTEAIKIVPGSRIGTYYVEFAARPRMVQVVYDRRESAASQMSVELIDWEYLLDTRILHLSGITSALSGTCRALLESAFARAKAAAVPVSFDVNYRSKLWPAREAAKWLEKHAREVEILYCAERDARNLFGLRGTPEQVIVALRDRLRPRVAVLTLGAQGALLYQGAEVHRQAAIEVEIVDRLGAGDALAAGVIDGWLDGSVVAGIARGSVLAALALSQTGDQVVTRRSELESLSAAAGSEGGISR